MREALAALVTAGAALAGCTNHECDASTLDAGGGSVIVSGGTLFWESAPPNGPWLDYPGNMSVNFSFPEGFACPFSAPTVQISTEAFQGPDGGGSYILDPGYIATITNQTATGFTITNGGCAEYYLRVTATASASGCGTADGGMVDGD